MRVRMGAVAVAAVALVGLLVTPAFASPSGGAQVKPTKQVRHPSQHVLGQVRGQAQAPQGAVLPFTGAQLTLLVVVAAGVIGGGATLLVRRRRYA